MEPMVQSILNAIQQNSPVNRYELLHILSERLETRQNVSQILCHFQNFLINLGCIQVEEYKDWKHRVETEKERTMNALIVPSGMGGFSIKVGDERPIGHYSNVADARSVLRINGFLDNKPVTPEMITALATGVPCE